MNSLHRKRHRKLIVPIIIFITVITLTIFMVPLAAVAQDDAPVVPHDTEGKEVCSDCHGQDRIAPAPADHSGYPDRVCLGCHEVVPAPAPALPHATAGKNDCFSCHGPGGLTGLPAGHESYSLALCFVCHEAAAVDPTAVPHETAGKEACTDCHARLGIIGAVDHTSFGNNICLVCHEATVTDTPVVPHDTTGKEDCLTCHGPTAMLPAPESHAGYTEDRCLLCHEVDVTMEPGGGGEQPIGAESCMVCHSNPELTMTLGDGEELPLYIDPAIWGGSVHGDKLLCTDCHTTITGYPHESWEIPSRRDYNIAQYELCRHCHFDNYTKTLDSIHYAIFSAGDMDAPLCTDCHGSHDITPLTENRANISRTCSQCHQTIYNEYISSVHGNALVTEDNYDVPVCTDCHASHTIEDPRTASFRLESVQLCANCHSDADLMNKYGISPNVVKTYLEDFHGRTVALIEKQDRDIWVDEAVCTDCHGIHDIQSVDDPDSPVIKANLAVTCGKCHDDVSQNFSGAWLSHYETTFDKLPLIFLVEWFYKLLIPFILVGLSIHVLLDLWRRITNR